MLLSVALLDLLSSKIAIFDLSTVRTSLTISKAFANYINIKHNSLVVTMLFTLNRLDLSNLSHISSKIYSTFTVNNFLYSSQGVYGGGGTL